LKEEATELRDKFRVYKLLAITRPLWSNRLTHWAHIMELFGMDSDRNCSIIS